MAAHAEARRNFCVNSLSWSAARRSCLQQRRQRRHPIPAGAQTPRSSESGSAAPKRWYFAYGANLSAEVLRSRGLPPTEQALRVVAPADAVLTFQHRGGFATIDFVRQEQLGRVEAPRTSGLRKSGSKSWAPSAAAAAADAELHDASTCRIAQPHGMLYLLSDVQLAALARRETGYKLMPIAATPYKSGNTVVALVFVSQRLLRLPHPVPPTRRYLDLIVTGAKACGLADSYIRQLEAVPTAKPGGLPAEYFDTPSGFFAAAAVAGIVLLLASLWLLHQ